jgi:hypothetical protein
VYYVRLRSHKMGCKANPTVTTEKAYPRPCRWQAAVRHRREMGIKPLFNLKRPTATLIPTIPGMHISGYNALNWWRPGFVCLNSTLVVILVEGRQICKVTNTVTHPLRDHSRSSRHSGVSLFIDIQGRSFYSYSPK